MSITQLPPELLDIIFDRFCQSTLDDANVAAWADTLPILKVCHQWRVLAVPHVYKYVFVECHDESNEDDDDDEEFSDSETIKTTSPKLEWLTNINLHKHNSYSPVARAMYLYIDANVAFPQFILKTTELLEFGSVPLTNLQKLYMTIWTDVDIPDSQKHIAQCLDQTASLFANHLQRLKSVKIFADMLNHTNKYAEIFFNKLLNLVATKLNSLISFLPTSLTLFKFTSQLSCLRIALDSPETCCITRECAESLKSLFLFSVPRRFSWETFVNGADSKRISLPNMVKMTIIFKVRELLIMDEMLQQEDINVQFYIPKIVFLRLEQCPNNFITLFRNRLPPVLDLLYVTGPIEVLRHIPHLKLGTVQKLITFVDSIDTSKEQLLYRTFNTLYGEKGVATSGKVAFQGSDFEFDLQHIEWTAIQRLCLGTYVELDFVITLISHLWRLTAISITNLGFDKAEVIGQTYGVDIDLPPLEPLKSNIAKFNVSCAHPELLVQYGLLVLRAVILRLPNLNTLFVNSDFGDYVRQLDASHPGLCSLQKIRISPDDLFY